MKIGAQTYTVRDHCRDTQGLYRSLEKIAAAGYTSVQLSGVCDYDPKEVFSLASGLRMSVDLTHFNYQKIINEPEKVMRFHEAMGCRYIGIGSCPHGWNPEGVDRMISELSGVLKLYRAGGFRILYHNHNFEFAKYGGVTLFERICGRLDPEEAGITLDAYWAQAGGADPAELVARYPEHIRCVHFKDMVYDPTDRAPRMAVVGEGNMNYRRFIAACGDASVDFGFVEQDNCYGEDPFDCLTRSLRNLERICR